MRFLIIVLELVLVLELLTVAGQKAILLADETAVDRTERLRSTP